MCPCPEVKGVKEDLALECHEGSSTRSTQYLSASFPSGLLAVALIQLPTVYFLGGIPPQQTQAPTGILFNLSAALGSPC